MIHGRRKYLIQLKICKQCLSDSRSNGVLDQPITLAEVSHVVKAIKILNLLDLTNFFSDHGITVMEHLP